MAAPVIKSDSAPSRKVLVLAGDHVGPEVMVEALKVLDVIQECTGTTFELTHDLCGGCSIDKHGTPITDAVLQKATEVDAVLFGSAGGPEWGTVQPNPESGLLRLRAHLNAFANVRPCTFYSRSLQHLSPLKPEIIADTDFIVLRENCGGAYYGPKIEKDDYASDTWEYTRPEIERVARVAGALAKQHKYPLKVTSSDKANVLASGRLWRKVVSEVFAKEFPEIELKHQLADSLAMIMIKDPRQFNGIVLTDNTFGDMLSDEAGGLTGSLGLLPSASLCGVPTGAAEKGTNGIYEPVHGSAPDISGQGKVNPIGQILSLGLMLQYSFGMLHEAEMVEKAVEKVLDGNDIGGMEIRTADLGGKASTTEVGDAVCAVLKQLLTASQSGTSGGLSVPGQPQQKRLSMLFAEHKNERPKSAHKDENLEWEKKLQNLEAEGLPRHEPLAL